MIYEKRFGDFSFSWRSVQSKVARWQRFKKPTPVT